VPSLSAAASTSSQSVSQSQPRTSQPRSSQPPPHSVKKASTDLLADIGGDPFAAPQVAPAFAAFPAFGGQTPSHGGFANFDAFGSSPRSSAFGSIPPAGQGPFQAQPTPTGSSQVTPFAASPLAPASQPNSLADMGSLLAPGASPGGIPSSIFGVAGQVPTLQSATAGGGGSTGLAFGAFTNPFTVPAAHPQLPSTNPFQPNGLATVERSRKNRSPACLPEPRLNFMSSFHRAQLWDEQCGAWLPPNSATHQGLCQHLPTTTVPPTDLDDSAAEWFFLQRLRISQAGAEATEPAS